VLTAHQDILHNLKQSSRAPKSKIRACNNGESDAKQNKVPTRTTCYRIVLRIVI